MKQVQAQIMGQLYTLGCPEGGDAALQQAVARVDSAMTRIREGGKVRARDRIAVLAAVNLAYEDAIRPVPAPAVPAPATPIDAPDQASLRALLARLDDALNRDDRLL